MQNMMNMICLWHIQDLYVFIVYSPETNDRKQQEMGFISDIFLVWCGV